MWHFFPPLSLLLCVRTVSCYRSVTFHMSASKCILQIPLERSSEEIECGTKKKSAESQFRFFVFFHCQTPFQVLYFSFSVILSNLLAKPRKKKMKFDRSQSNEFNASAWDALFLYLILLCSQLVAISYRTALQIEFNS